MCNKYVYMDNAASTLPSKSVLDTMNDVASNIYANPSSIHELGLKAKNIIDKSKEIISNKLNCSTDCIYFTSGATMSNCLAIQGWLRNNENGVIIISSIEHNDIIDLCNYLKSKNYIVEIVDVNKYGEVNIDILKSILNKYYNERPILVSIQMANSEIGIIQDIKNISTIVHNYGAILHTDATQYIPHYDIDINKLNIDMLSMSGQKINCIKGIGILYVNKLINISPIIFGEQGLIGGTENVIGIACLGKAFEELDKPFISTIEKRDYLICNLLDIGELAGSFDNRLPNNVSMIFRGIHGEDMVQLLNEHNICVSSGSACSSHVTKPSHVLKAIGYNDEDASSCVRFTIDKNTTYDDIDYVIKYTHLIYNMLV